MPKHQLTELAAGERVISERVPGVRSVALGFWIGAGSRDEPDSRAGVSHFIEHLLFKGSSRYSAQEIAEIFDELGGELNAATSRETTVLYARIPDDRLERALDVMADMVFRPQFADIDSEREVVLEEIAMVEDTPNDLVHDVAAEAVFGRHPLGRPVIGTRRGHLERLQARARRLPPAGVPGRPDRARGSGQRPARGARRAARRAPQRQPPAAPGCRRGGRCVTTARPAVRFLRKDTEQYHVCLSGPGSPGSTSGGSPRRSSTRSSAARRRRGSSRRSARSAGMAYSVYSYASQYGDGGQVGVYVGTREENLAECLEITVRELSDIASGNVRAERARTREGEPQGPDPALARVDVGAHDAARQVHAHRHAALTPETIVSGSRP